jgi:hypothetical protein
MSKPYGSDSQIFTFGVHGTANEPKHVKAVTEAIAVEVNQTTKGAHFHDTGFSWNPPGGIRLPPKGTSHLAHDDTDREVASKRLASHVLAQIDKQIDLKLSIRTNP